MKITKIENVRVVIEPYVPGKYDPQYAMRIARQIQDSIKRHIDDVGCSNVEFDTVHTCSHCGYGWEVDKDTGEPLCCVAAIAEWENNKTKVG